MARGMGFVAAPARCTQDGGPSAPLERPALPCAVGEGAAWAVWAQLVNGAFR